MRWNLLPKTKFRDSNPSYHKPSGLTLLLSSLLVQRGITTFAQAKRFFRPSLEELHDPFLMQDMDLAVERIQRGH